MAVDREAARKAAFAFAAKEDLGPPTDKESEEEAVDMVVFFIEQYQSSMVVTEVRQWRARADGPSAPWHDGKPPNYIACETRTLYSRSTLP